MTGPARLDAHRRRSGKAIRAALWPNLAVWAMLLVLLGVSLGLAYVPLGPFTLWANMAIAATQAGLIATVFMSLRRASALILLVALAGVLFALVEFSLTFNDLFNRS